MTLKRLTTVASVLLLLGAAGPAHAASGSATSGFSRPSSAPSFRPSSPSPPPAFRAAPSATSGFKAASPTAIAPAARPSGSLDATVNQGMSRDAYESYKARQSAPAAPSAPFVPSTPYSPPPAYASQPSYGNTYNTTRVYVRHDRDDGFLNGAVLGALLSQAGQSRSADWAYDQGQADARRQLQQIANDTDDPAVRDRIERQLRPVQNPVSVGTAQSPSGGSSHVGLVVLLLLLAAAGTAGAVIWKRRPATRLGVSEPVRPAKGDAPVVTRQKDPEMKSMQFRPGGYVKVGETALVLAEANGSDVPDSLGGMHSVQSVGRFKLYGMDVERAYFDGGKSFVEHAPPGAGSDAPQIRVYREVESRNPANDDDWAFFMGGKGSDGAEVEGMVGAATANLPPTGHDWFRSWGEGDAAVPPVRFMERVQDATGAATRREFEVMHYHREIGRGPGGKPMFEYAYFGKVEDDSSAAVKVWVGIDVPKDTLEAA